jgi:peptidoglycan/LPS O-acetylase OafA/YrhL
MGATSLSQTTLPRQEHSTVASFLLDFIRALAAIAVLFSHARVLFLQSGGPDTPSLPIRLFYMASGYGHSAVMIFFVLSGYLVGGSIVRSLQQGRWSWRQYLLARGARLYIVLIPALLLTVALDALEFSRSHGLLGNPDTGQAIISSVTIHQNTTVSVFLANLFFLQTILAPTLGSNTALWSLANEFWYYLIFPCLYLGFKKLYTLPTRIIYISLALLMLIFVGKEIALYFSVWLLGALLALAPRMPQGLHTRAAGTMSGLVLLGVLGAVALGRLSTEGVGKIAVAVAFVPWLSWLLSKKSPMRSGPLVRLVKNLAGCSYTLYAVHLPFLIALRACWTYERPWPATLMSCLQVLGVCATTLGLSWLLSRVTEARTDTLRKWLDRCLPKRRQ